MPRRLTQRFRRAKAELRAVQVKLRLYEQLFDTSAERSSVLSRSSPTAWQVIQQALVSDIYMSIQRLLDRARQRRRKNLSLPLLMTELPPGTSLELCRSLAELLTTSRKFFHGARDHRNRRIGHNDVATMLSSIGDPLPDVRLSDVKETCVAIAQFLNLIGENFGLHPIDFDAAAEDADGDALVAVVLNGLKRQEESFNETRRLAGLPQLPSGLPESV